MGTKVEAWHSGSGSWDGRGKEQPKTRSRTWKWKSKIARTSVALVAGLTLICVFLWQASVVVTKYESKLTSLQERLQDSGSLLYPSVTFCTKYIWQSFPGVLELLNKNKSMDFKDIKDFAQADYWSRDKVFSFFSHQNVMDNSFPCNTVGGSQTGKPCSFPFIYQSIVDQSWSNVTESSNSSMGGNMTMGQEGVDMDNMTMDMANMTKKESETTFLYFDTCTPLDDVTPWCYTRTEVNLSYILGHWGYCDPSCSGQRPKSNSEYNLAMDPKHWEVGLFDLSTWGSGICHTYNPPSEVEPGVSGQLYTLLGDRDNVFAPMRFLGFNIYLHDKGQFFPGLEMGRIGLSDVKFLPKDIEWEGSFKVHQKTLLNSPDNPCSEDPDYSFQSCVMGWVARKAGCHLDWFSPSPNSTVPCEYREHINLYNEALTEALQARWLELSRMTGCVPRCMVRSFAFVEKSSSEANWGRNWSAAFYLDVKTSSFTFQTEFYAYDIWELTSGLGGLMGIFLGWDFLFIIMHVYKAGEEMSYQLWIKKKEEGEEEQEEEQEREGRTF